MSIYSKEAGASRRQFPIRLAYAMTSQKTQGETLDKGTYMLIILKDILVQHLYNFQDLKYILTLTIIEPFSFDRLTKIANYSTLKEEERLTKLNKLTYEKYKYLLD